MLLVFVYFLFHFDLDNLLQIPRFFSLFLHTLCQDLHLERIFFDLLPNILNPRVHLLQLALQPLEIPRYILQEPAMLLIIVSVFLERYAQVFILGDLE